MTTAAELSQLVRALATDESGATLVEYAFVVALVAGASLALLTQIGSSVGGIFTKMTAAISSYK